MSNKIIHWIASIILFGVPIILSSHTAYLDVTVGGILNAVYLAISQWAKPTVPLA